MRRIRKKGQGPTLRESWIAILIGIAVVALIVTLVYIGVRTARREQAPLSNWALVAGDKGPVLPGLPPPKQTLEPLEFSRAVATEADALSAAGASWILVYALGDPPAAAEVVFFLRARAVQDLLAKTPGLAPFTDPGGPKLGDEAFTLGSRLVFRRGGVLVRVRSDAGGTGAAKSAAHEIDRALVRAFGVNP